MTPITWTPEGFAEALKEALETLGERVTSVEHNHARFRIWVGGDCFCPITLICFARTGRMYESFRYLAAADEVGYEYDGSAGRIANAADRYTGDSTYRAAMKRVLDSWEVA